MVATAIIAMVVTLTAHHLGFFDAMLSVASKIAKCYKCCTFWVVFGISVYRYRMPLESATIAFAVAYLSHWAMLIFGELNIIYGKIWQKQNDRRNRAQM